MYIDDILLLYNLNDMPYHLSDYKAMPEVMKRNAVVVVVNFLQPGSQYS